MTTDEANDRLLITVNRLLADVSFIDWHFVFSAPMNGGSPNAERVIEALKRCEQARDDVLEARRQARTKER